MADTIITSTPRAQDGGDSVFSAAVVAIIIAAIAIGAMILYQSGVFQAVTPKPDAASINITVPTPTPTPTPTPAQ